MTIDLQTFPPLMPGNVPRVAPATGFPTAATLDFEQSNNAWYLASVTDLQTQTTTVQSETNANTASIVTEVNARTAADEAFADELTTLTAAVNNNTAAITNEATARANEDNVLATQTATLTTTLNGQTAQLSALQASYNGIAVEYSLTGTINNTTGGFIFSGVQQNDGSVVYNMEFDSNVVINGNLLVNGTVNTPQVANQAINVPYLSTLTSNGSFAADGAWHDVLVVTIAGGTGYYAFIYGIGAIALYQTVGNTSYGRVRLYSDTYGDLTGNLWANYGQVDASGNPGTVNAYLSNALNRIITNVPATDTIRFQINNTSTSGHGGVFWASPQSTLCVEVRKR